MGASPSRRYSWEKGARNPKRAAEELGKVLERVADKGHRFKAAAVVNAARPASSPLHKMFDWNNTKAAEKWRNYQAGALIRRLVVEVVTPAGTRSMPAAVSFGPGDGYQSTDSVLSSDELRARLIAQALGEAERWAERYRYLHELSGVFDAVSKAGQSLQGKVSPRTATARQAAQV